MASEEAWYCQVSQTKHHFLYLELKAGLHRCWVTITSPTVVIHTQMNHLTIQRTKCQDLRPPNIRMTDISEDILPEGGLPTKDLIHLHQRQRCLFSQTTTDSSFLQEWGMAHPPWEPLSIYLHTRMAPGSFSSQKRDTVPTDIRCWPDFQTCATTEESPLETAATVAESNLGVTTEQMFPGRNHEVCSQCSEASLLAQQKQTELNPLLVQKSLCWLPYTLWPPAVIFDLCISSSLLPAKHIHFLHKAMEYNAEILLQRSTKGSEVD